MNEYRKRLMPNVYLKVLPARKFKTGCLSAQFITALDRDRASYNALLPAVLNRGTMRYPDMESLSAAMDTLYGTTITTHRQLRHLFSRRFSPFNYFPFSETPPATRFLLLSFAISGISISPNR